MSTTAYRSSGQHRTRHKPSGARLTVNLNDLPLMLTVSEVAEVLRIGRNGAYAAVADGTVNSVRIGRTIRVPRSALAQVLGLDRFDAMVPERSGRGAER